VIMGIQALFDEKRRKGLRKALERGEPIRLVTTRQQMPLAEDKPLSREALDRLDIELFGAVMDGDLGAVKKCLEQGADINARDYNGDTVLIEAIAEKRTAIVEFLVSRGADVNARNNEGYCVLDFAEAPDRTEIAELIRAGGAVK